MKKIIDAQPIIDQLKEMSGASKGLISSVLHGVISMLEAAPEEGNTQKFVLINGVHISANQIRSFEWKDGELCIWYAGHRFFTNLNDSDRKLYKEMCFMLGVLPAEDLEKNDEEKEN